MFENLINQFRPTVQRAAERAETMAHRAISHLEIIAENTTPDRNSEVRRYESFNLAANAVGVELFQVPSNQTWELEAVTLVPDVPGSPISLTLRNGPSGAPIYSTNTSSPGTQSAQGVVLSTGMVVVCDSGANSGTITLQIMRKIWQPDHKIRSRQGAASGPEPLPPSNPDQLTPGHMVSGIQGGVNVHGERANGRR